MNSMLSNSNTPLMEQTSTSKATFSGSASAATNNSNNTGTNSNRYSPSNFYRAAAAAAANSDPTNRRYMPTAPVCFFLFDRNGSMRNGFDEFLFSGQNRIVSVMALNSSPT